MNTRIVLLALLLACASNHALALDLAQFRLVDMSYAFDEHTLYWPGEPTTFRLESRAYGKTEGGYFYSANAFCTPEHGGTHLDAPIHFAEGAHTNAEIPLEQLLAAAVVIDVSAAAAKDRDYRLSVADVQAFEQQHGRIEPGTTVLLRTGWSRYWPDRKAYFGDDTPGDTTHLSFPSFGEEAARLLVEERSVGALGVDTASIDYGRSSSFGVHRIAAARNVIGLENLANLDQLPARGATVIALPMKIAKGSGGPLRAVALVPR